MVRRVGQNGLGFFWKSGWAFVLGFFVSGRIKQWVVRFFIALNVVGLLIFLYSQGL